MKDLELEDPQLVSSLPDLFSNVKYLGWIEEDGIHNNTDQVLEQNCPPKETPIERLKSWKDLKYLHDEKVNVNISARLLAP